MLLNMGLEEAQEWERTQGQSPTDGTGFRFPIETQIDNDATWKISPAGPLGLDLHQEPGNLKIDPGLGTLN